jgi:hypothetical protein
MQKLGYAATDCAKYLLPNLNTQNENSHSKLYKQPRNDQSQIDPLAIVGHRVSDAQYANKT